MNTKLSLLDWDGTLRPGYTTIDWMHFLHHHSIVDVAHILELSQIETAFREGKADYETFIQRSANIYANAIAGTPRRDVVPLAHQFVRMDETNLFSFCKPLLMRLRSANVDTIVISGAPIEPLLAYADRLPITTLLGVEIAISYNNVYTNTIKTNYGLLESKTRAVQELVKDKPTVVLAIGNSINDLPLLSVAKQRIFVLENGQAPPIQFAHPKDVLESVVIDT